MQTDDLPAALHLAASPMDQLLEHLSADSGFDPQRTAWLLPRIEQASALRKALVSRAGRCAGFAPAPVIVTADRLSDHARSLPWLDMVLQVMQQLRTTPGLALQAQSASQLWDLAAEYAELALACVAVNGSRQSLEAYRDSVPMAGAEANVALLLADVYRDTLNALLPEAPRHPHWARTDTIVWLDDGEPLPGHWLRRHAGARRVLRVSLLLADDPVFAQPLTHEPMLLDAPDVDALAHAAASRIADWLREDCQATIGVAVVDRLFARRVRSLLEAADIRVDDRTGWRLSTTRVAGWLHALLQAWFSSDWAALTAALEPRWMPQAACFDDGLFLQAWLRKLDDSPEALPWDLLCGSGLVLCRNLDIRRASEGLPLLESSFQVLRQALSGLGHHDRSLSDWAADVLQLLALTGAQAVLQADGAGQSLLGLLRRLQRGLLEAVCSSVDFLLVLDKSLEASRFRDEDIASPVRFMPLQSFRLQRFARVLVLGCAARHFVPSPPGLLPPGVATELGFSDAWLSRSQSLSALQELVQSSPQLVFAHARFAGGRAEPLLGWLRALLLSQQRRESMAHGQTAPASRLACRQHEREVRRRPVEPLQWQGGRPVAELSVEAVSDLAACPLKFALTRLAGLRDRHPGVDRDRTAVLRGMWVHDVFERLHKATREAAEVPGDEAAWLSALQEAAQAAWIRLGDQSRQLLFRDRLEFERYLPELAKKTHRRAQAGWRVRAMEHALQRPLTYHESQPALLLSGRLDCLEAQDNEPERRAIVDIKTTSKSQLQQRSRQWMDYPQLPLYAWLLGDACEELAYLAARGESPDWLPVPPKKSSDAAPLSPTLMAQQVVDRLTEALVHVFVHPSVATPLPGESCQWCDFAATCRHAWWAQAHESEKEMP
jgi:ATP-dependent helicase/nuclease subunit B